MQAPEGLLDALRDDSTDEHPWTPMEVWLPQLQQGPWASGEAVATPIKPVFNMANAHSCHVCKRGPFTGKNLLRCGQCKLVQYCCKEHAKHHWPAHKKGCKVLLRPTSTPRRL